MNPFRVVFTLLAMLSLPGEPAAHAQPTKPTPEVLSPGQALAVINSSVIKRFAINFPIVRVYRYVDRSGQYYCVLTESLDSVVEDMKGNQDTLHFAIRAINLKKDSGRLKEVWEINDHAMRTAKKYEVAEQSIWFWTKYVEFSDFDDDGLIEPIIVFGASTNDDVDAGRVKFIIYYKGQKVAIRHHDSDLDEGRSTQIDRLFYSLPSKLKQRISEKMKAMNRANQAIFEKTSF